MVTSPLNYKTGERLHNYLLATDGKMYRLRTNRQTQIYPVFVEGHWRACVCINGKQTALSLYRLLWVTFVGELETNERVYSLTGQPNLAHLVTRTNPNAPILRTALGSLQNG